jgi:hypothetical protein
VAYYVEVKCSDSWMLANFVIAILVYKYPWVSLRSPSLFDNGERGKEIYILYLNNLV